MDFTEPLAVNSVSGRCVASAAGKGRLLAEKEVGKARMCQFLLLKWTQGWLHNVGDPPDPGRELGS